MRPTLPLSVQLLLTFVGLLTGITLVLTTAAYTSLLHNLEADARRTVSEATRAREQSLAQLFQLRQQRAQAFLVTVQSLCTESVGSAGIVRLASTNEPSSSTSATGKPMLS